MADTLESLELQIQYKATGAAGEIGKVTSAVTKLGKAIERAFPQLQSLAKALESINNPVTINDFHDNNIEQSVQKVGTAAKGTAKEIKPLDWAVQKLVSGMTKYGTLSEKVEIAQNKMNEAFKNGDYEGAVRAREQMLNAQAQAQKEYERLHPAEVAAPTPLSDADQQMISTASEIDLLKMKLESLNAAMQEAFGEGNRAKAEALRSQIIHTEEALARAEKAAKGASEGVKQLSKEASKSQSPLNGFLSSLKRIAFYRIIRGIIKSITQAFQEGLEKAYLFSTGVSGEGNRFAAALDRMKSAGNQMKGQLGSAFIGLLAAVEPVLISLINIVTKVADAISQLFAAFTGKTYLKANATAAQFADTMARGGAAAKEWKNQLLGFDEINRLNEPNKGGGGGGTNPLDGFDFDDTPLDEWAQKLHDILANLTLSFDNIFFKWENLTSEDIAQKVITGLTAVAGGIIGFALGGLGGATLGMTIGASLGVVISSLIFNNDGKIDENEFVGMIIAAMGGIGGAIIGFSIGGVAGAALGFILGVSISLVLQKMNWLNPVKGQSVEVVQEYLDGVKESFDAATPGTYEASYFGRWKRYAGRQMQEAGKASADGFDEGVEGEFTVLGWLESVWERIKNNVRTSFGIHSPSTVFEGFGNNIVQGLWNGLSQTWGQMESWWSRLSLPEFHIPCPHFDWTYTEASGLIAEALKFVGLPATIPHLNISWYAQGGFPTEGQLFFANEAGPELVGTMGGRTAVANNQEITEGIRQAVYDAMMASNANGNNDVSVRVYLDSREIKAGQQRLNRAWGV